VTRNPYIIQNIIFRSLTAVAVLLLLFSRKGHITFAKTYLDKPLAAYGILIALSLVAALIYYPQWKTAYFVFWGKRMIFFVFNCLAVFYISFLMAKDSYYKKILIYALIATASISAFYAILQYTGHEFIWPQNLHHYGSRSVSTFGNPTFIASFEVVIIILCLWAFTGASTAPSAIVWAVIFSLNFFALLITQTRSSWAGAIVALVIYTVFALKKGLWKKMAAAFAVLFLVAWIFPKLAYNHDHPTVWSRLTVETRNISNLMESSGMTQRLLIWGASWRMFRQSPVFGHGWGSFEIRYPVEQGRMIAEKPEFGGLRTHANNSHSEILEQLSQLGIVGFFIFAAIWLVFFYRAGRAYFESGGLLVLACAAAAAGFMADNMLGVTLNFPMPVMAFWAICGIAVAESSRGEYIVSRKLKTALALKIILSALVIFFIKKQVDYFKGEMKYFNGFTRSRMGDIKRAAKDCLKSWRYYHWNTDNNYELGNCFMRLAKYDREEWATEWKKAGVEPWATRMEAAVWAYKEALKANPGYDEIYYNLAIAYQSMGEANEAEKNYREAASINPVSAEYFLALGNHFLRDEKTRDIKKAEEFYSRAFELKPDSPDIANNLAYVYMLKGDLRKSYELYKKALEINPAYDTAKRNLESLLPRLGIPVEKWRDKAIAAVKAENFAGALSLFRKIIDANPGDAGAAFYLGNCLTSLKRFDEAASVYERLVKFHPGEKNFATNLAKIYYMRGDRKKAVNFLEEISPNFPRDKDIDRLLNTFRGVGGNF